ncbi:TonB-dependent receptor [Sphingosinicella rhizophila]|uniref:TonB-dependent receptor n=1 Tax=Sphingosinicella rhizophila TaxID=3050082 RepID=A0ABU3Q1S1_9SPHN|nr:TonB-dependent receptor [Sphingosinicella sp. GR2756]MDT9597361.1 TonB-dependent receptor [Sphingosinicella sp. GR2756]
MLRIILLGGTAASLIPQIAFAQTVEQVPSPAAPAERTAPARQSGQETSVVHHDESQEIIITGNYGRTLDFLSGSAVLAGSELLRDIRPQLGDTLGRLPGVSSTSFSPGASRPVLRGFQGERIRVLTDGIGSIDVSNTSADHAVTIDPLTAERIEVLHGPAVLLFGSQAIGGAVNVLDRRIPRAVPENGVHLDAIGAYGSAADERSIGGAADVALGKSGFVLHIDGSYRKTDDLGVGGYILSPTLRAEQLEMAAEELEEGHVEESEEALEGANRRGRLPNSATEQKTLGAGLALIRDGGSLGFSVSWFDSNYGVPTAPGAGHHHHEDEHDESDEEGEEEGHGEEAVTIGLEQIRADLRGQVNVRGPLLDEIRIRVGAADYEHTEYEGDEVGTIFRTQGLEGRFELVQTDRGGWSGASGAQFFLRDFEAIGAEAFVPPNETSQFGIFSLQEIELGGIELEAAGRYERSGVTSKAVGVDRSFDAFSAALGVAYEPSNRLRVGLNLSRAERAPSAEELLSNGPHIATQAFEIGDPTLDKEKSWGAEVYVRAQTGPVRLRASIYANWFDDYIFQAATGDEEDELPVFQYFQRDARYYGFEAEASATLFRLGGFKIDGDLVADYVRATIDERGPVPRIPPLRVLGGLEAVSDDLTGRVEVEWADDQERIATFETPTDGYTLVNASLAWRPWGKRRETTLILSANNIFDVDARRHASFTKEFVPMAGRDIRVTARFSF